MEHSPSEKSTGFRGVVAEAFLAFVALAFVLGSIRRSWVVVIAGVVLLVLAVLLRRGADRPSVPAHEPRSGDLADRLS